MNDSQIVEFKNTGLKEGESLDDGICRLGIYKKNGFVPVSITDGFPQRFNLLFYRNDFIFKIF